MSPMRNMSEEKLRSGTWANTITALFSERYCFGSIGTTRNGRSRSFRKQRTRLDSDTVRIPDVSVWARNVPVEPVFSNPQLIVVEVLSPEDRQSRMQTRIEDFRRFGVPHIWVVDPAQRLGWDCSDGNWIRRTRFEVSAKPIYLDLNQLFRDLDAAEA